MDNNIIKKLQDLFSDFPTVGQRTASRFVFYLTKLPAEKIEELIKTIQELKSTIKLCSLCFQPFESLQEGLCSICLNPSRNKELLCIIEKEADLISIENTKKYQGLYFILGGQIPLRKIPDEVLRIEPLKERVKNSQFNEIIIALNPTPEGRVTSALVERALKELPQSSSFKITYLAKGLPVGGELEYADEETLESAFEGRK